MSSKLESPRLRVLYMLGLIIAGETVYTLPYHVARYFRPTMLEVFDITATELGAAQGLYGVIAMLAYFPRGPYSGPVSGY